MLTPFPSSSSSSKHKVMYSMCCFFCLRFKLTGTDQPRTQIKGSDKLVWVVKKGVIGILLMGEYSWEIRECLGTRQRSSIVDSWAGSGFVSLLPALALNMGSVQAVIKRLCRENQGLAQRQWVSLTSAFIYTAHGCRRERSWCVFLSCRPGTRRLTGTCSWLGSVLTRPSGTTSWPLAGTWWFLFWPSSCSSSCSSTWARPRAPLTSSERTVSKISWNCSAGRWAHNRRQQPAAEGIWLDPADTGGCRVFFLGSEDTETHRVWKVSNNH